MFHEAIGIFLIQMERESPRLLYLHIIFICASILQDKITIIADMTDYLANVGKRLWTMLENSRHAYSYGYFKISCNCTTSLSIFIDYVLLVWFLWDAAHVMFYVFCNIIFRFSLTHSVFWSSINKVYWMLHKQGFTISQTIISESNWRLLFD